MKNLILRCCTLLLFCALSHASFAAVISFGDYQYTEGENTFSGGGLEWLRWDQTVNQSVSDALATYSAAGWRLATNQEMADLVNSFGIAPAGFFGTDETQSYQQVLPLVDAPTVYDDIISFLGATFFEAGGDSGDGELARFASAAMFGDDANGNDFINGTIIQSDSTYQGTSYDNVALMFEDTFYTTDDVFDSVGVALVRDVPEPPVIALMLILLALIIRGGSRFRLRSDT